MPRAGDEPPVALELDDIQCGLVRPRPSPYAAAYLLLRIDEHKAGRELMRRLGPAVASAAAHPAPGDTGLSVLLSFSGLKALGVPRESLQSFAWEFREGMVRRAPALGDVGESSPERWESPLGTPDVHVVLVAVTPSQSHLERALQRAAAALESLPGVVPIWRQDCHALADGKEPFGYRDGIAQPAIEGSGIAASNPREKPLRAGEFVLGYRDELGGFPAMPQPEILGRNGTYVVFRKLHQRVAAFRSYLKDHARTAQDEERLAAKIMGRWRSGAPLALSPLGDDPGLGIDPERRDDFLYRAEDAIGYRTPAGSHIRRTNPRDAAVAGVPRLHRMIRRGTAYGPPLAEGVMEDDGADRGLMFAFLGAHPGRQFEFVQSEWINDGAFLGLGTAKDPLAGAVDGTQSFAIPDRPLPRRLQGLPRFVITRGGEYCFMPGLRALRWLAELA
jgi:Dyp-type peroxidase family